MNILEQMGRARVVSSAKCAMKHVLIYRDLLPEEAHELYYEDLLAMIASDRGTKPKKKPSRNKKIKYV